MNSRLVIASLMFCLAGGSVRADSLYAQAKGRSMFADRKAHAVGDVVTVVITESTVASQAADTNLKKDVKATANGGSKGPFNILDLIPKASLGGSISQAGTGTTTRSSKLVSMITCKVTEITPAGQLVLKGERALKVN